MMHTHTHDQFLKMSVGLSMLFGCFFDFVPVLFAFVVLHLVSLVLCQEIG